MCGIVFGLPGSDPPKLKKRARWLWRRQSLASLTADGVFYLQGPQWGLPEQRNHQEESWREPRSECCHLPCAVQTYSLCVVSSPWLLFVTSGTLSVMKTFSVEEGLMSLQMSGAAFTPLQEFYLGSSLGDLCRLSWGYAHSGSAPPTAVLAPPTAAPAPPRAALWKLPSQLLGNGQTAHWRCPLCPNETWMTLCAPSLLMLSLWLTPQQCRISHSVRNKLSLERVPFHAGSGQKEA